MAKESANFDQENMSPGPLPLTFDWLFSDHDQFQEIMTGWNLETVLMDKGGFTASISYWATSTQDYEISWTRYSAPLRQSGQPPAGLRTLVVPMTESMDMFWRGRRIRGTDLLMFPAGGELDAFTKPGFNVVTISVPEECLEQALENMADPRLLKRALKEEVLGCTPETVRSLRGNLERILSAPSGSSHPNPGPLPVDEILRAFMSAVDRSVFPGPTRPEPRRHAAARRVAEFIDAYAQQAPRVGQLLKIGGISERALEYGFRDLFGVTPKAYLQAQRLNMVRKELVQANPADLLIADVANKAGFWHMGQFARDYRQQFGELPSETLAKPVKKSYPTFADF